MRTHILLGALLLATLSDASAHVYNKRNETILVASPTSLSSSASTSSISSTSSLRTDGIISSSTSASSSLSSSSLSSSSLSSSSLSSSSLSSSSSSLSSGSRSSSSRSSSSPTSTSTSTSLSTSSSISTTSPRTTSTSSSLSPSSISTSFGTSSSANSSITGSSTRHTTTSITSSASNSSSSIITNSSTASTTQCTGCILQALSPDILTFPSSESSLWVPDPSTTVTQTVIVLNVTYEDGSWSTTNLTESATQTFNRTAIPFTTPVFEWSPADQPDITLTFDAGSTYVAFTNIRGGLESQPTPTAVPITHGTFPVYPPATTCEAEVDYIPIRPTNAEQYSSFIATFKDEPILPITAALPSALIQFLQQDPSIIHLFNSSDLGTCTVSTSSRTEAFTTGTPPAFSFSATPKPSAPEETRTGLPLESFPSVGGPSPTETKISQTNTYLSTETTVKYSTTTGKLRNQTPIPIVPPTLTPQPPDHHESEKEPENPQSQKDPDVKTPDLPGMIASIINDPGFSKPANNPGSITFGNTVLPVRPAEPTNPGQNGQSNPNPGVVIGTQTLAPGEATQINGVLVSVPPNGGGSSLVVGGSTVGVNPVAPTGPAVLTVGDNTVTANNQGQFVFGTQTLTPGGPAITVGGSTLSLGPSGTIGVVNGVTQTLGNAPVITAAPVLTVGHQTIPATVIGGSTMFVLGPGQTLTPGGSIVFDGSTFSMPADGAGSKVVINGATQTLNNPSALPVLTLGGQSLTASVIDGTTKFVLGQGQTLTPGGSLVISGTTYSMPADGSGSTIVVNGVTQTLNNPSGLPVLTLGGQSLTASVVGGTTQFIIGPGQTLTPGGVLTISGTTFSMPASASGSVVVVNGVTSTLGQGPITAYPALTIDGKTYSATIRDGTTEFVLGPGTTLKPGEQITISGTTYSLDSQGTALIINGKTSSIPKTPASNSATTTGSGSKSQSTSGSSGSISSSSSFSSSTTSKQRDPGNFIASGIGISKKGDGVAISGGLDKWAESMLIGFAGWLLMFV